PVASICFCSAPASIFLASPGSLVYEPIWSGTTSACGTPDDGSAINATPPAASTRHPAPAQTTGRLSLPRRLGAAAGAADDVLPLLPLPLRPGFAAGAGAGLATVPTRPAGAVSVAWAARAPATAGSRSRPGPSRRGGAVGPGPV